MTVTKTTTFDATGVSDGDAVTTANAATCGDAPSGSSILPGLTYSAAAKFHGTFGLRAQAASGVQAFWDYSGFAATTHENRLYYRPRALTASTQIQQARTAAGQSFGLTHNATGQVLNVLDAAGAGKGTSPALTTDGSVEYRIDYEVLSDAAAGTIAVNMFIGDDMSTPIWQVNLTGQNTRGGNIINDRIGKVSASAETQPFDFDAFTASDAAGLAQIGPEANATGGSVTAPAATATGLAPAPAVQGDQVVSGGGAATATARALAPTVTGIINGGATVTQPASKRLITEDRGDSRYGAFYVPSASGTRHVNVITLGAKGDNATDDTAKFQTALDAGGVVVVPGGNYKLQGNLSVTKAGTMILGVNGSGPGVIPNAGQRSVLRRMAGSAGNFLTFASGTGPVVMSGIEIDGGSQPGTLVYFADAADVVNGEENQAKISNCYFHDTAITAGSWTDGDVLYIGKGRRNARFNHCYFYGAGRHGVTVWASDTQFTNCMFGPNGYAGIMLESSAGATRVISGEVYASGSVPAAKAALTVTGITTANPAVVTTSAAHGLSSGQYVKVAGAGGVTSAINAVYRVTVLTATTFSIPANNLAAYTSGGTVQPVAYGIHYTGAGIGSQFLSLTIDRNYFGGFLADPNTSAAQFLACDFNSNSRFQNSYSAHIELLSSGHQFVGVLFGAQASGLPNKAVNAILTYNSSQWFEAGNNFVSSGVATSTYSNFPQGKRLVPQGVVTLDAGSDGYVPLTVKANSGAQTADLQKWQTSGGNDVLAVDPAGHLRTGAGAGLPTVVVGAGAGTGATATITGSDVAGVVTITTGTAPAANALAAITFAKAFSATPQIVMITAHSTNAQPALAVAALPASATSWSLYAQAAPAASTTYVFAYLVIG